MVNKALSPDRQERIAIIYLFSLIGIDFCFLPLLYNLLYCLSNSMLVASKKNSVVFQFSI